MNRDEAAPSIAADATASEAVVAAVADRAGVDQTDIPPLYGAIDPDALDALFRDGRPGRVTFEYAGHKVTVCGRDQVTVICEPLEQEAAVETTADA